MQPAPAKATLGVVVATGLCWRTPANDPVLDNISVTLGRDRAGLVGANGAGKTTLARILAGQLAPAAGSVSRSGAVAYLPQDFKLLAGQTVAEALGVQERLAALHRLTAGHGTGADLALLDDDWSLEERVEAECDRLGLAHLGLDRRVETLSGGEATRVALAGLFLGRPDLVILDEPTNNLDAGSRQALYAAVTAWRGGLLVVSHDRTLLGLMDRILEVSPRGLRVYGGNYDVYAAERAAEAEAAQRDLDEARKELRRTRREAQAARERQERRSSRGKKARDKVGMPKILLNAMRETSQRTTARVAETHQDRSAAAQDAVEEARARVDARAELDIDLAPVELPAGKTVLDLADVSFGYEGGQDVLSGFSLRLTGPERVAVIGPNGSGKSTLFRLILGELAPAAGSVSLGVERVSCLDQKASLLDDSRSVLENFRAWSPGMDEAVCRLTLARFLFRGDTVHKPGAELSGGERLRAALACVLCAVSPPRLLMLDEPTNHLDLDSLANLEQALRGYTGALLVISHDRTFLENVGVTRTLELAACPGVGGVAGVR
jgi:ATPase subunit of ABC transporter with duplicated ATPase domains